MGEVKRTKNGMMKYSYRNGTHSLSTPYSLYAPDHIYTMYFVPDHDFSSSDAITINGEKYYAMDYSRNKLTDGFFTAFSALSNIKNYIECRIDPVEKEVFMNKLAIDEITELMVYGDDRTVSVVNTEFRSLVSFSFIAAPCYGTNAAIATMHLSIDNPNRLTSYISFKVFVNGVEQKVYPKSSFGALDTSVPVMFMVPLKLDNVGQCTIDVKAATPAAEVNLDVNTSSASLLLRGLNLYNL